MENSTPKIDMLSVYNAMTDNGGNLTLQDKLSKLIVKRSKVKNKFTMVSKDLSVKRSLLLDYAIVDGKLVMFFAVDSSTDIHSTSKNASLSIKKACRTNQYKAEGFDYLAEYVNGTLDSTVEEVLKGKEAYTNATNLTSELGLKGDAVNIAHAIDASYSDETSEDGTSYETQLLSYCVVNLSFGEYKSDDAVFSFTDKASLVDYLVKMSKINGINISDYYWAFTSEQLEELNEKAKSNGVKKPLFTKAIIKAVSKIVDEDVIKLCAIKFAQSRLASDISEDSENIKVRPSGVLLCFKKSSAIAKADLKAWKDSRKDEETIAPAFSMA